jgi:hypothetical protein
MNKPKYRKASIDVTVDDWEFTSTSGIEDGESGIIVSARVGDLTDTQAVSLFREATQRLFALKVMRAARDARKVSASKRSAAQNSILEARDIAVQEGRMSFDIAAHAPGGTRSIVVQYDSKAALAKLVNGGMSPQDALRTIHEELMAQAAQLEADMAEDAKAEPEFATLDHAVEKAA